MAFVKQSPAVRQKVIFVNNYVAHGERVFSESFIPLDFITVIKWETEPTVFVQTCGPCEFNIFLEVGINDFEGERWNQLFTVLDEQDNRVSQALNAGIK